MKPNSYLSHILGKPMPHALCANYKNMLQHQFSKNRTGLASAVEKLKKYFGKTQDSSANENAWTLKK